MYPGFRDYPPRVLLILPVIYPSATIYIIKPLRKLARQGKIIFNYILETEVSTQHIHTSDLVIFCRSNDPVFGWILEECAARSIPTVYELDDNFWEVPLELHYAKRYRSPERIAQLERYISHVDTVRVYSSYLGEVVKSYNQNVIVVTPCIDFNLIPTEPKLKIENKIRITYVTGRGNEDPLLPLFADDLLKLLDKHPGQVEMYWWGEIPEQFRDHPGSYMVDVILDYDQFLNRLARKNFDIGLAPLTATPFNLSKTNTKFRDYGASRIAGIYSNVDVYSSCVQHNETGLLVGEEPGAWFEALTRLVSDEKLRLRIINAAFKYVKRNYSQELVEMQWLDLLNTMLAGRQLILSPLQEQTSVPEPVRTKLSLGCLDEPPQGFFNLGQEACPNVDVIANLSQPLPFVSGSIDQIVVNQTLGKLSDTVSALQEIYRVSRDGAKIWMCESYSWPGAVSQYESRSFHFNEESPKAWSPTIPPLYEDPLLFPDGTQKSSLIIEPIEGIDLRCYQLETFYKPAYLLHSEEQKRRLRREKPEVCDLVIYQLKAVKGPSSGNSHGVAPDSEGVFEPGWVERRRLKDRSEIYKMEIDQLRYESQNWHFNIQDKENELVITKTQLEHLEGEYEKLARLTQTARETARQLDAFRSRKAVQLTDRFIEKPDYSDKLSPAYQKLLDDSRIFLPDLKGYRLQPSINLQRTEFLSYSVEIQKPKLCGLVLAPVIDLIPSSGSIGVEIESPYNEIVAHIEFPAESLNYLSPVTLKFPSIKDSNNGIFQFRVFVKNLDVPLRIYEWHRFSLLGFGRRRTQPFFGYIYPPDCSS